MKEKGNNNDWLQLLRKIVSTTSPVLGRVASLKCTSESRDASFNSPSFPLFYIRHALFQYVVPVTFCEVLFFFFVENRVEVAGHRGNGGREGVARGRVRKGSAQRRRGCNRHGSLVVSKQLSNFNETRLFLRDSVSVLRPVFV